MDIVNFKNDDYMIKILKGMTIDILKKKNSLENLNDCLNEAWVLWIKIRDKIDYEKKPSSYIYTCLHNALINYLLTKKKEQGFFMDPEGLTDHKQFLTEENREHLLQYIKINSPKGFEHVIKEIADDYEILLENRTVYSRKIQEKFNISRADSKLLIDHVILFSRLFILKHIKDVQFKPVHSNPYLNALNLYLGENVTYQIYTLLKDLNINFKRGS